MEFPELADAGRRRIGFAESADPVLENREGPLLHGG
jgi:hypothetical protein